MTDHILEIGIDADGKLYIKPETQSFQYIYRSAAEVHWDDGQKHLYSPTPREWSYADWFKHIIAVVKEEYGCALIVTDKTKWMNIPALLKTQITSIQT